MKLASLLEQHRRFVAPADPLGLRDSLGDGFLVAKNRIYGSLRKKAIGLGFLFTTSQNDAYRALPLSQLDTILSSKAIPYLDNVTVLESIENKIPKQTVWNDISDNLKGNSVFHESCHAFARAHLHGVDSLLGLLLEESFANTCELLSILDADDQAHRIFLELNSYIYMLGDRVHLMNAEKEIGLPALIRYFILAYLHSNFLRSSVDFDRVVKLAVGSMPDAKTAKNLRHLSKIAFELNPRFREVTTQFYLKLHGLPAKLDLDFMSAIEKSKAAQDFLKRASDV